MKSARARVRIMIFSVNFKINYQPLKLRYFGYRVRGPGTTGMHRPGSSRAPPRLMAAAQSDSRSRMEKSMSASILHEYTTPTHWDETSDASVPRRRDGTRKRSNLGTMDRTTDKREARLRSVSKIWIKTSGNQIRKPRRLGSTLQIFYASYEPIGSCCSRS